MAKNFDLKFNDAQLLNALEQPFQETNELLGRNLQEQISDTKWGWPESPSPRDIVDTGRLRDSYQGFPAPPHAFEHAYNVEYAMAVHEGAVFEDGRSMPARPWIRVALHEFDFKRVFTRLAERELSKVQ